MLKYIPIILPFAYAMWMYYVSARRTAGILSQRSKPLADPELTALLIRFADILDQPHVQVYVFDDPSVNGLASPDGRVFLTEGFMEKYRQGAVSASELASVVAHELGHVAMGHTKRRMVDMTGQNALAMLLASLFSRFIPGIGPAIAQSLTTALAAGFSRKDEYEADAYASALMVKSGLGLGPQKSLFAKLEHLTGHSGADIPAWLRSHPHTHERIKAIETRESQWLQD